MLQMIKVAEKQYEIQRVYPRHPDSNEERLVNIKNGLGYDALIKNDQFYFLCNEITDAIFTEVTGSNSKEITDIPND